MKMLYMAHSGIRYLVVLMALLLIAYCIIGLATKQTPGRPLRILNASFVGILDLQVLLGLCLVISGIYYPALIGHIVMMVLAVVVAHGASVMNKKRATPSFAVPLVGALVALALVAGGIMAIGRGIMETVPYPY